MLDLSPADLGMPPKFQAWRPHQERAIEAGWNSEQRWIGTNMPTGLGKSAYYMALASLAGRTVVLTSTKALQNQLINDFAPMGLVDIRGRANYSCHLKPGMNCDDGSDLQCHHRFAQAVRDVCPYRQALERAKDAQLVVTNYAYWILQNEHGGGLGNFKLLVLDEAHAAMDELCGALSMEFTAQEMYRMLQWRVPQPSESVGLWRGFAQAAMPRAERRMDDIVQSIKAGVAGDQDLKELRRWKVLVAKLKRLAGISDLEDWIVESLPHSHRITPLWPAPFARSKLFLDVPKVVLVSAILTRYTMDLLGVPSEESVFDSYPAVFSPNRYPLIHIPTVRVNHRWKPEDRDIWMKHIDLILAARRDRKGIIHTVSYERAREIYEDSRWPELMLLHDSKDTVEAISRFRSGEPPLVLVSPSVTTGHDFPYSQCEFQILAKVPWPDCRTPLMAARVKADTSYRQHVMCQTLVQSCGRGMRAADDRCESFITDDYIRLVLATAGKMLPYWFRKLYRRRESVPVAPARLETVL